MQGRAPLIVPKKYVANLESKLSKAGWMDLAWMLASSLSIQSDPYQLVIRKIDELREAQRTAQRARRALPANLKGADHEESASQAQEPSRPPAPADRARHVPRLRV